jgi:hypothetical protein
LESARPLMIAGFANEVDAINQYAPPVQAATRHAASHHCTSACNVSSVSGLIISESKPAFMALA